MANLTRYTQSIFGAAAGFQQMAQYGSFAAGSPNLYDGSTITPAIVQSLGAYATGWFTAVEADYSPAIEDMNALCYLFGYQLTYIFQWGVPVYDAATTYNIGSIVNDGFGVMYSSLINSNVGNTPVSSPAAWGSLIVPDGFRVGAASKVGVVSATIENDSVTNGTDGVVLTLTAGASSGVGTSSTEFVRFKNGGTQIKNYDNLSTFDLLLNINNGSGLNTVIQALNNGKVNFPFGLLQNNNQIFTRYNFILTGGGPYTYNRPSDLVYLLVFMVGGGGGGGGATGGGGTYAAGAGGGGAGFAFGIFDFATVGPTQIVTAGNGGGGGSSSGSNFGSSGGDSTFGSLMKAEGGAGGGGLSIPVGTAGSSAGSTGGFGTGGLFLLPGGRGGAAYASSAGVFGGFGGASSWGNIGIGGIALQAGTQTGQAGEGYGCGGSGGAQFNDAGGASGTAGTPGNAMLIELLT